MWLMRPLVLARSLAPILWRTTLPTMHCEWKQPAISPGIFLMPVSVLCTIFTARKKRIGSKLQINTEILEFIIKQKHALKFI